MISYGYLVESFLFVFTVQIAFFVYAVLFKTDKVTDLSYGLTFILLAFYVLVKASVFSTDHLLLAGLILVWGLRLMLYLFVRILKIKADKRFDGVREHFGKFAVFWTLQAITIFLIMIPVTIALSSPAKSITGIMVIGAIIWILGFVLEAFADAQKFNFKNNPRNKSKFISSGLWRFSRHPNYFGEMTCWWGVFIFTVPYLSGASYLSVISPIFITFLLLFVSGIPPLEKKYDKVYANDHEYQEYKRVTSVFIPLPPKD